MLTQAQVDSDIGVAVSADFPQEVSDGRTGETVPGWVSLVEAPESASVAHTTTGGDSVKFATNRDMSIGDVLLWKGTAYLVAQETSEDGARFYMLNSTEAAAWCELRKDSEAGASLALGSSSAVVSSVSGDGDSVVVRFATEAGASLFVASSGGLRINAGPASLQKETVGVLDPDAPDSVSFAVSFADYEAAGGAVLVAPRLS